MNKKLFFIGVGQLLLGTTSSLLKSDTPKKNKFQRNNDTELQQAIAASLEEAALQKAKELSMVEAEQAALKKAIEESLQEIQMQKAKEASLENLENILLQEAINESLKQAEIERKKNISNNNAEGNSNNSSKDSKCKPKENDKPKKKDSFPLHPKIVELEKKLDLSCLKTKLPFVPNPRIRISEREKQKCFQDKDALKKLREICQKQMELIRQILETNKDATEVLKSPGLLLKFKKAIHLESTNYSVLTNSDIREYESTFADLCNQEYTINRLLDILDEVLKK